MHDAAQGKKVLTPPLDGTILPGVTRGSVLQIANSLGYEAAEEKISIQDACDADEVFTTGAPTYMTGCFLLLCISVSPAASVLLHTSVV